MVTKAERRNYLLRSKRCISSKYNYDADMIKYADHPTMGCNSDWDLYNKYYKLKYERIPDEE